MLGLLYYGRLEKEKGFDALLEVIKTLQTKEDDQSPEFFIFGAGSLERELLPLTKGKKIHYFGWQPLEKIKQYLENIDYCLMPSEFLETFGLSALNALSRGIPVIGYKKGGLEPFILPECNLFAYKGKHTKERLMKCIEKLHNKHKDRGGTRPNSETVPPQNIQQIVAKYTKEIWYQHFLTLCGQQVPKKIVLVSDFINKVGGIETYLHDVKAILEAKGHHVYLRGGYVPKGTWGKLRKYLGLLLAPINFWSARKFKKFLKKENPDLIRFHSLLRNLGRNVVKRAQDYRQKKDCPIWMMYHDFGYFYPFPRKLFFVEEVQTPLSFQHFMVGAQKEHLGGKLATIGKYLRIQGLVTILKTAVDVHLVPSDFMVEIVKKSYQLPEKRVKAFHHFMQE